MYLALKETLIWEISLERIWANQSLVVIKRWPKERLRKRPQGVEYCYDDY